jgi:hypothetical protein
VGKTNQQAGKTSLGNRSSEKNGPVEASQSGNRKQSRLKRGAITVFILFHIVAITIWTIPSNSLILVAFREVVRPYMLFTGLFQSWDTFAPNPRPVNTYIKAVVITQNHHLHVFMFPRMEQLSYWERYKKERYRKFKENIEKNVLILPDVVRYVARSFNDPADPPYKVTLIQFQSDIAPGNGDYDPLPKPGILYEQYIEPGDLK